MREIDGEPYLFSERKGIGKGIGQDNNNIPFRSSIVNPNRGSDILLKAPNDGKLKVQEYLEVRPGVLIKSCGDIGVSCVEIK